MNKTVLILVDGMRPDSLAACGHPFVEDLKAHSRYTLSAHRNALGHSALPYVALS